MRHYRDLSDNEQLALTDTLEDDLVVFFENARKKYDICDICLHSAVIAMCQAYLNIMMEEPVNGVKH